VTKRFGVVVGLAGLAAMLAACSRGTPSDFAVYRGEGFSVAYPGDWKGCHGRVPLAGGDAPAVEVSGPAGRQQVVPPIVQVANEGTRRKFDHALNFHRLLLQVNPGYKQLAEDDADVSGAKRAVRIEFEQQFPLSVGQGQPKIHGMNLLAEAPDGSVVSLLASATEPDFERLKETFEDVLGSLAVGSEIDQSTRVSANLPACSAQGMPQPSPSPSG
jgi:hypothetical protein